MMLNFIGKFSALLLALAVLGSPGTLPLSQSDDKLSPSFAWGQIASPTSQAGPSIQIAAKMYFS